MKTVARLVSILTLASIGSVFVNRRNVNHLFLLNKSVNQGAAVEFLKGDALASRLLPHAVVSPHDNSTTTYSNWRKTPGLLFVHVGKAGGMTVTRSTTIGCMGSQPRVKPRPLPRIQQCMQRSFATDLVLPYKVTKFMHMFSLNHTELQDPDYSFLFVLRNPVDRYISAYKYGHPSNCNETINRSQGNEFRCPNQKLLQQNKPNLPVVRFYRCFPTLEDLAQYGVISPIGGRSDALSSTALKVTDKTRRCNPLARRCAVGVPQKGICGGEPHKSTYNYKYYASHTVDRYPYKAVLAIRTEHEWHDLVDLDQQLGGTGQFKRAGLHVSHGSESYENMQLSPSGYQKLCCVLMNEMELYRSLLLRAVNLNEIAKHETLQSLYGKCDITTSWSEWKASCQERLDRDETLLRNPS